MPARPMFALLAALLLVPSISQPGNQPYAACDRDCLTGILTSYLAAHTAHDPSNVAAAPGLRVTEDDAIQIELGDGLWKTISPYCGQYCRRSRLPPAQLRSSLEETRVQLSPAPACLYLPRATNNV